jgi:hypothetical protein
MRRSAFLFAWIACAGCSSTDPGLVTYRPRDPAPDAGQTQQDAGAVETSTPEAGAPEVDPPLRCIVCINAGGPQYASAAMGKTYEADTGATAGETYTAPNPVNNTNDSLLYQSERYGNAFNYVFNVPNGSYTLKLHFAEVYYNAVGQRVFNVDVQGQKILENYDIVTDVGAANAPVVKTYSVNVTDGTLTIAFTTVVDNAKVSAIELLGK